MTKTYEQVMKQIETLSQEAEKLRRKEVQGVVARIKEAVVAYGLTASDLGLSSSVGRKRGPKGAAQGNSKPSKSKVSTVAKFRDEAGNTWVGRGPRPHWLREALASGKKLEDFAV